jgi:hypothetical protein
MKKLLCVLLFAVIFNLFGCLSDSNSSIDPITYTTSTSTIYSTVYIKYEIIGTAPTVDITIENSSGGTSQYGPVSLPWTSEFTVSVKSSNFFAYLSAQNNSSSGSVTCNIYNKYKTSDSYTLFKSSTSNGAYVIATADGTIGAGI